ncbi:MAG: SOS response-associated peptidase [Gammaproteobacteria bacterium]|nr:SOS response-associated peptidase [Gammaproteobacteria bacterium]
MCGRINVHDHSAVQALLDRLGVQFESSGFVPRYNVAPGARLVVAHGAAPQREATLVEWGFVPPWARPGQFARALINARAETIRVKPSFRRLIKSNRVVIPVNGFYEWRRVSGTKTPFYIRPASAGAFAFAGIQQPLDDGPGPCCVITTAANDKLRSIHSRMPVILAPSAMAEWLDGDDDAVLDALMVPAPDECVEAIRVSDYVNDARHDGAQCVEPVDGLL